MAGPLRHRWRDATSPKGRGLGRPVKFMCETKKRWPCGLDARLHTRCPKPQGSEIYVTRKLVQSEASDPICQGLPLWERLSPAGGSLSKGEPRLASHFGGGGIAAAMTERAFFFQTYYTTGFITFQSGNFRFSIDKWRNEGYNSVKPINHVGLEGNEKIENGSE